MGGGPYPHYFSFNSSPSFDPLCSVASYYLNLPETVGQTRIKAEHREGTQLILELLSVRAAAWEFSLSRLGKWFSVFRQQSVDDEAMVV